MLNWKTSAGLSQPDVHGFPVQGRSAVAGLADKYDLSGNVFAIGTGLMRSRSRGYLRLLGAEPGSPIEIQPNFLCEPEDVSDLIDAVDLVMDLAATKAYADWFDGYAAPETRLNRANTVHFIRTACSTFFHTCGTAKMGNDNLSVVDERLAVRGIEGLRIADASIIPIIPSCNTHAAVSMIGERAADFILNSARNLRVYRDGKTRSDMTSAEFILAGDFLLTMDAQNRVISGGAAHISDGRILGVDRLDVLAAAYPSAPVKRVRNSVLMPGLINAHAHSGFLRGTAEHLPVWDWLTLHINPMHRVLQPHEAAAASRLCYAESVIGGTTTVVDMWRFMEGSAKAAEQIGNRLVAVPYVGEHPEYDYFDTLDMNEAMIETWHRKAGGRVNVWVGLEHLFYADEAGQRRAIELAKKYGTGFHTHCSEAEIEVAEFSRRYAKRPMFALDDLGFFETSRTMIAHGVWLDASEIELISRRRVSVAHNPVSNMKLASGIARVGDMLAAGIAVGIGTDGEKENNNFDMFEEMKVASLLGKLKDLDAAAMDSWQVLRMATITGARAIGLDHEIGSIEAGKRADIIAVRTDTPRMTPLFGDGPYFNLQHNLVHAVRGGDVAMTMVDGKILVEDGVLKTADLGEVIADIHKVAPGHFSRRAAFLAENAGGTVQWTQKGQ